MARTNELLNDRTANKACRTSDKNTHTLFPLFADPFVRVRTWQPVLTGRRDSDTSGDSLRIIRLSEAVSGCNYLLMATKRSQSAARKPRMDAQRNRERILEVAKEAFTRFG